MRPRILHSLVPFVSMVFCHATLHADTVLPVGQTIIDTTGNPALGIITRVTGTTVLFNSSGTATATGTPIVNGILGPWAFIGTGASTRYATLDGSNNVVGYTGATASNAGTAWGGSIPSGGTGIINYDMGANGTLSQTGLLRNINTLRYTGTGATQTSNTGGAAGADIFSANGIMNAGSGLLTIGGGGNGLNILIGTNKELVVAAVSADVSLLNIIKDNAGGASALTKTGPNKLTLTGANTYTGGTSVNQGTVAIGHNTAFGTGAVAIGNGTTVSNSSALSNLANTFTGSGSFTTGTGQATLTGNWSGFAGSVSTVSNADIVFNGAFSSGVSVTTSENAAYVNNYSLNNTNGMIVQNQTGATGTYKLGSYASAVGSNLRNAGSATGSVVFEIGNLNTSTTVAGTIGGGAQTVGLTKVGTGTLTLGGANTYTGATLVSAGTLLVNGSLANTAVSVTAGTLGGSGSITGTVAVGGTGTLSAGNSIESLATGALSMSSGSTLVFEAANSTSTGADLIAVNGTLSLTGVALSLDAATLAALGGGSWSGGDKLTLLSYLDGGSGITSGFTGYVDDAWYLFNSNEWTFNYNDTVAGANFGDDAIAASQNRFVTLTLVPEPSVVLLGGIGMLGLLRRRRA